MNGVCERSSVVGVILVKILNGRELRNVFSNKKCYLINVNAWNRQNFMFHKVGSTGGPMVNARHGPDNFLLK